MKRKVQAQRKFAQGAFIPPAPVVAVANVKKEGTSNVTTFVNKLSAASLLDQVALNNCHIHLDSKTCLEPVVRLERLTPITVLTETDDENTPLKYLQRKTQVKKSRTRKRSYTKRLSKTLRLRRKKPSSESGNVTGAEDLVRSPNKSNQAPDKPSKRRRGPGLRPPSVVSSLATRSSVADPRRVRAAPPAVGAATRYKRTRRTGLESQPAASSADASNESIEPAVFATPLDAPVRKRRKPSSAGKRTARTDTPSTGRSKRARGLNVRTEVPETDPRLLLHSSISISPLVLPYDDLLEPRDNQPQKESSPGLEPPPSEAVGDWTHEPATTSEDKHDLVGAEPTDEPSNPNSTGNAEILNAPIYYPTEEEFRDPIVYFQHIMPMATKFGICKVVAPASFKPKCIVNDKIKFNVSNQYVARMYRRWGTSTKEMAAIKAYLDTQQVKFTRAPSLDGIETDLPQLYHLVQLHGGIKNVIERKRWSRVAADMRVANRNTSKLDKLYLKYLLPYGALSNAERGQLMERVSQAWHEKNQRILKRAVKPLHRQRVVLGETSSSDEGSGQDEITRALQEAEDCVVGGRIMTLSAFKSAAAVARACFSPSRTATAQQVEKEYWRIMKKANKHVCVNTASIDTGEEGYGFTKNKREAYGKHPWNLKMFSENKGNVLRSLGPVLGVTVPTLHVGMMFSTSCWHRDPHSLPWIEYMHNGPAKIWYGIPDQLSDKFRSAVTALCPTACQNKAIWLPSDITMIPPDMLLAQGVPLSRVVQRPREFIIVFPRAYSSSICTGYTQSESVYFATASWLHDVKQVFQTLRNSCEPSMFSLDQLLLSVARDRSAAPSTRRALSAALRSVIVGELGLRAELRALGVPEVPALRRTAAHQNRGAWSSVEQDECEACRATLYLSKVTGLTGFRSSLCLPHALHMLKCPVSGQELLAQLVISISATELKDVLNNAA